MQEIEVTAEFLDSCMTVAQRERYMNEDIQNSADIKKIRKYLQLTQSEFANVLCVSERLVQDWEQGRREPARPVKRLMAVALENPLPILRRAGLSGDHAA